MVTARRSGVAGEGAGPWRGREDGHAAQFPRPSTRPGVGPAAARRQRGLTILREAGALRLAPVASRASNLYRGVVGRLVEPWQVDGKHAAFARKVASVEPAVVGFG